MPAVPADPAPPAAPRSGRGPLLVWAAWTVVTALPFAITAWGAARRGRFFPGAFLFPADIYQYLSFVEQAARGALLFENKFDLRPFEPFFLNLEWLGVGWLAAALGGRVLLAFHLAGALAGALLAAVAARVLRLAGLDGRQAAWGLALLLCGSGLGWLRVLRGARLAAEVPDAYYAIFPWTQRLIGGPHALVGTALLLLGLVQLTRWRAGQCGPARWLLTALLLGLSRPFDLGLLLGAAGALWALDLARGAALATVLRQAASCAWLAPVAFYDYLALRLHPSFGLYSSAQNTIPKPPLLELAVALGPALLLALGHLGRRGAPAFGPLREALLATAAIVLLALALPVSFSVQFLNSLGALLLLLAATALPPRALPVAVLALCPTSLWWFSILSGGDPGGWPGPDTRAALAFLERDCSARDRLLAPEELSMYASGLTACRVVAGHWVLTPEFPRRRAEVGAFYAPQTHPGARAAALESWRPTFVLAPPGAFVLPGYAPAWKGRELEIWRRAP